MHQQYIDRCRCNLCAVTIACEWFLDLRTMYSVTLEKSIQFCIVFCWVNGWTIGFVMAQKEFGHVFAVTFYKMKKKIFLNMNLIMLVCNFKELTYILGFCTCIWLSYHWSSWRRHEYYYKLYHYCSWIYSNDSCRSV